MCVCVCVCVCVYSLSPVDTQTHTQELPHCLGLSVAVVKSYVKTSNIVNLFERASTVGKCENKNGRRSNSIHISCGIAVISIQ